MLKGQRHPIYVELLPTSPKFHSVLHRSLVFQIIEVFNFPIGYNCEYEIFGKKSLNIGSAKC